MAELSTKRANFYKQVYFPSTYYKEVFEVTLDEAKDIQEAQKELNKLLIDADTNLARLSETFRERALSPGQQLQVQADEALLATEAGARESAAAFAASMRRNPVSATGLTKAIADAKIGEGGQTPTAADTAKRALTAVYREASKYAQSNPAMARRIMADGLRAAEGQGIEFGAVATELNQRVQEIAGQGVTRAGLTAKVGSDEDKAQVASFTGGAAAPATPTAQAAQARLDALSSPFANASTEQTARVAAGLKSDKEDELLRLYLSRLQDKDTPGVVTPEEFEAEPRLAAAEQVYNDVKARNSYLKSAAEWYSDEYLTALKTKSNLEAQAKKKAEEFRGLDPYRWAQQEALKRGGYTKESLLHLRMLTDRPDLAPYVNPAFTRLRAEGGLAPASAAEATVRAAFEQNPNLTVAELDGLLREKRAALTKQGRQVGREAGFLTREAAQERRGARETANELYATPEAADAAKAYLLALRLNRAGTPATPDVGTKVEFPVTAADVAPTPVNTVAADAARAAADAKAKAEEDARAAAEGPTGEEGVVELPPQKLDLDEVEAPTVEDLEEEVVTRTGFTTDPTNPDYKYLLTSTGDYAVLYKGLPTTTAKKGTQAHESIAAVLRGDKPLPPAARGATQQAMDDLVLGGGEDASQESPDTSPLNPVTMMDVLAGQEAGFARLLRAQASQPTSAEMKRVRFPTEYIGVQPQASPEQYEAMAATETNPVKKKALTDMAARMRAQAPAPAAPAPAAPAPVGRVRTMRDPVTGEIIEVQE